MAERKRSRAGRVVTMRHPSRHGESTETRDSSTQATRTTTLSPEDAPGLRLVAPGPVVGLRVIGTERELHLPRGQRSFTLGTSAACDLVIPRAVSTKVSGLHATVGRLADGRVVIENRNKAPYRVATVAMLDGTRDTAGVVRFASDAAETAGAGVLGVVRPGGRGKGVVVVRRVADLVGKRLTLVVAEPGGRGKVAVDRVVLR